MTTGVRTFLREFPVFKARARKGGAVHISDKKDDFLFTAVGARKPLLGVACGKIAFHADISVPTLCADGWKPSL
jgi:hypothetical protein